MQHGESSKHRGAARPTSLALVEAFRDLPVEQLAELEQCLVTVPVARGEVLMRQGDAADALYLVASGRFVVEVDGRRIAEVGNGSPLGEIGFFADGIRTATVTALRDSIVFKLPRADFVASADRHPAILKPIAVTLARRLADTLASDDQPRPSHPRTIAVISSAQSAVPEAFRQGLTRALSRFGQVSAVDSPTLASALPGETSLDSAAVTSWFNKQELRYHYVLYFADAELTPFSRKTIRQADQVLIVGDAESAPELNALERFVFDIHPVGARRLLLLHDARTPISGTSRWLDTRPVAMHHHLVADEAARYDRLARFISGNAIGFVACGGGALCAAHIGVYKAFIEAGISFDLFGGTSGGGAMAAAFAMGASPEEVSARTAAIFLKARALKRVTWPRYSLLDHTVFDRALQTHYGDTEIEDLWTGYFAVSTCLTSNALCLITRGPVWKAVRATSSIPGLLPPVYHADGRMLVDGSLLDNVPVRSMRRLKSGPNVVVNLRSEDIRSGTVDYAALPSRGRMLRQLLNPFARRLPRAPGVATVLLRSLMVHRERLSDTLNAEDLLVAPPLPEDVNVMDWHRHAELTARAYDHTAKLIEGLRAAGHPLCR
ncbi:MAG: cyclic nucleotide-binding and patatin-like phospholipase domain-containing protein [Methyloceanibacter sp.]